MEISKDLIYAWRKKAAQLPQVGSGGAGAVTDELRELRGRLADLQLENDILKKAAVILGTKPQPKAGR